MPRLAVIGHPIAHSLSPKMQSAALREMGLAGEWSYEALDVEPLLEALDAPPPPSPERSPPRARRPRRTAPIS